MNLRDVLLGGLVEIRHHKLRSFLTLIGIILGTFSIIFMTSMLNGIILSVWEGFEDLGYDGVMYVVQRQPRDSVERARFGQSVGLRPEDADVLLARRELVTAAAPVQYGNLVISHGGTRRDVRVAGVTPSYAEVRRRDVAKGRFISDNDVRGFRKVCVLGHRLRLHLFGTVDPIGREVTLGGGRFIVIGVGKELGNQFVNDSDFIEEMEGLYVPLTTLRKYTSGEEAPLAYIAVKTAAFESLPTVQAEVQAALSAAHHGVGDFKIENIAQEMLRERDNVTEVIFNWQVVLGTIAGISLLVGGIGLLSVMIISINERLYEIGMRKAIGASDVEIFAMFLIESVTLALVGACTGAGMGIAVVKALAGFFPAGLPIDLPGVAAAIGVAVLLGLAFGVYPALKASRMMPVDAMRGA
ncbi:MAG TPA: ABC transporter permease [Candidatus Polarisedimenticolia bacterium]|nr:ABC transporter permease [Candidatus Polarisedimenticolia bacterium]